MPEKSRPPRRPLGFFDARDRIFHLNSAYRAQAFSDRPLDATSRRYEEELAAAESPEPDEELEDAELGEGEWREAVARERLRRQRRPGG